LLRRCTRSFAWVDPPCLCFAINRHFDGFRPFRAGSRLWTPLSKGKSLSPGAAKVLTAAINAERAAFVRSKVHLVHRRMAPGGARCRAINDGVRRTSVAAPRPRHLEHDVASVTDDPGADLDQLLAWSATTAPKSSTSPACAPRPAAQVADDEADTRISSPGCHSTLARTWHENAAVHDVLGTSWVRCSAAYRQTWWAGCPAGP
jgi:hypothetical protein